MRAVFGSDKSLLGPVYDVVYLKNAHWTVIKLIVQQFFFFLTFSIISKCVTQQQLVRCLENRVLFFLMFLINAMISLYMCVCAFPLLSIRMDINTWFNIFFQLQIPTNVHHIKALSLIINYFLLFQSNTLSKQDTLYSFVCQPLFYLTFSPSFLEEFARLKRPNIR